MCVDIGDAYIPVRTNYVHGFQVCHFPTLSLYVFCPSPSKSEVCMYGEVLSSLWLATPTRYRVFTEFLHARILPLHGRHAGVQQHTVVNGEKHFRRRYGVMHKTTHPMLAYIEDAVMCVIICKTWND